jgi:hypothetical protein
MTAHRPLLTFLGLLALLSPLVQGCDSKREANKPESTQHDAVEDTSGRFALVIKGLLVDEKDRPLPRERMLLYLGNRKTTLDTKLGKSQRMKKIEGTGTLQLDIEGIEGGGAYKVVDGKPINPSATTDDAGRFRIEVSPEFIEGEEELIIARQRPGKASFETESLPILDENGRPLRLKVETKTRVLDLGRVTTLQK